jgi:hypothetical protein
MQTDYKDLYKEAAIKAGGDPELYKDLGNFIFAETSKRLRRPKKIITKLKGIGYWYMRKVRLEILLSEFPKNFHVTNEDFKPNLGFLKGEDKKEVFQIFNQRKKEYDEYISKRNEKRQEYYSSSSKDNLEEHSSSSPSNMEEN